jgi:hypothetical protein
MRATDYLEDLGSFVSFTYRDDIVFSTGSGFVGSDEILKAELEQAVAECERLREENARLRLRVREAPNILPAPTKQFSAHNNNKKQASSNVSE